MAGLAPFASPDDLASALGVDVPTGATLTVWTTALADASNYLRYVIGQPITAGTVTLTLLTNARGEADVWLVPVSAVTTVTDPDGNAVSADDYLLTGQQLLLPHAYTRYTVTVSYGYDDVPDELVRWTKVLASAQIQAVGQGNLGWNNITSVAIDDGKVTFSGVPAAQVPDKVAASLRATYGGQQ